MAYMLHKTRSRGFRGRWFTFLLRTSVILTLYNVVLMVASSLTSRGKCRALAYALLFYAGAHSFTLILVSPTSTSVRACAPYVSMKGLCELEVFTIVVKNHIIPDSTFIQAPMASLVFFLKAHCLHVCNGLKLNLSLIHI